MSTMPALYAHPFSSYCQKVLVALYENDTAFEYRRLDQGSHMDDLARLWPVRRFPVLVDGGQTIPEASTIIEYLVPALPWAGAPAARIARTSTAVRSLDRFFDNYVSTPQQKIVFDRLRPEANRDPHGVNDARRMLDIAYAWLDDTLRDRTWASGDSFTLADCGAAPFLFYADWTHPIDPRHARVHAYRQRLLERPSFARAVDEARPFRAFFPAAPRNPAHAAP